MATGSKRLARATALLSKYFGLPVLEDLLSAESLRAITGEQGGATSGTEPDALITTLISNFMNTSSGALTSSRLIDRLNDLIEGDTTQQERLNKVFKVYFTSDKLVKGTKIDPPETSEEDDENSRVPINTMLQIGEGQSDIKSLINSNPTTPTKESPSLSIVTSNSPRVGLTHRDVNSVVVFLNGLPNTEINRAVPFVNITFYVPGTAVDQVSKRIKSLSLNKFLVGEQKLNSNDSALGIMANAVSASNFEANYTAAGMEIFTAPQTLVNADEGVDPSLRPEPILDKFRPFMTLKSFNVDVAPSTGLMSFKTAELKIVLHDRSRMSEIADFIRPDHYSKTELLIEYGWSHPDGESLIADRNPYGDLINGMRAKEKYGVINSSFTFDDAGQVYITLRLAMKGVIAFDTELISSDSEDSGNNIKDVVIELQESIAEWKKRVLNNVETSRIKEIRGVQILNASQDALKQVTFDPKLRKAIRLFRSDNHKGTADAGQLVKELDELFGNATADKNGKIGELRKTIAQGTLKKIDRLSRAVDPFLLEQPRNKPGRVPRKINKTNEKRLAKETALGNVAFANSFGAQTVSLGSLFLNFIAEPLATTQKFDDIQLIFYPFNSYAGKASKLNIANFGVDLNYFTQEYQRLRLQSISKSGNLSLRQFLGFIAETLLDDPSAVTYGLNDKGGPLHKEVFNKDLSRTITANTKNPIDYQRRLEKILEGSTPDGSFKLPQIDFYIEALPEISGLEEGEDSALDNGRTILRIHIFDRNSTSYDTLSSLLASTRDNEIEAIRVPPVQEGGQKGLEEEKALAASSMLSAAKQSGIIEAIPDTTPPVYKIIGGARAIKDFMMKTMPYIIYGASGTGIKIANLSSQQDPALNTINILKSFTKNELEPEGEHGGGLPMRIIPADLSVSSMGCPLINFAQQFFVDFQTGTTVDAIYGVVALQHKFEPGEFTTEIKLTPLDGWGRYISLLEQVNKASAVLKDYLDRDTNSIDSTDGQ